MSELFFFRKTVSVVILFAWLVLMTLLVGCSSKSLSQADKQLLNSVAIEPTDVIYSFNKNTILFNTSRTAWAGALGGAIGALIYEGLDDDSPENIILFQLKKDNMLVNTISQAFEYQIQNSDLFHVSNKDSSDAYFQIEIDGFQFHELNTPNLRLVSSCKASLLSTNNHRILWKGRESFTAFNKSLIEYPWEDYVNDPSKLRYAVSVVSQMLAAEFIKDLGGNPSPVSHALYKLDGLEYAIR